MDGWIDDCVGRWMNGSVLVGGWMDGWIEECVGRWMNGSVLVGGGWMVGWMNVWVDG